ncbi:hypothetical protein EXS70_04810 [Candidatus Peribacteria bacterium]|nr:hypothetical protein [Candidatus Peribacteria bacterium]
MPLYPHNTTLNDIDPAMRDILKDVEGFEKDNGIELCVISPANFARYDGLRWRQVAISIDGKLYMLVKQTDYGLLSVIVPVEKVRIARKEILDEEDLHSNRDWWGARMLEISLAIAIVLQATKNEESLPRQNGQLHIESRWKAGADW